MSSLRAVITAGGLIDAHFAASAGTRVKALAPFGGGVLIDRAIAAARASGAEAVAVIGGDEVRAHCAGSVDAVVAAADDGSENVRRALAAWTGSSLLYLTSDLPFIAGDAVRTFLERSAGSAIAMPLAAATAYETRFPGAPLHVMTLGGERFANGSIFFIRADAVDGVTAFAQRFFAARKSALAMAALLGPALLMKYALKRLTIADIEGKAQRLLGADARAVRDCAPELCYDIDTADDYAYARALASG